MSPAQGTILRFQQVLITYLMNQRLQNCRDKYYNCDSTSCPQKGRVGGCERSPAVLGAASWVPQGDTHVRSGADPQNLPCALSFLGSTGSFHDLRYIKRKLDSMMEQ